MLKIKDANGLIKLIGATFIGVGIIVLASYINYKNVNALNYKQNQI